MRTTSLCVTLIALLLDAPCIAADRPPNVLLIVIDDLGWRDLRCQGNKQVDTSNVDRLATQGMRFTDAYAAAPVCSPTRAALLTGQSPARLNVTNHISNRDFTPKDAKLLPAKTMKYLPAEKVTIAERLRDAGYATGFIGKWHVAGTPGKQGKGMQKYYPERQGFDVNHGGCAHGGPPSYFDPYRIHNLPDRKKGEYLPYRLADEAVQFIETKRDKPFCLALWTYTVHWPMQAPENLIKKYEKRLGYNLKDARYGAMIEAMDEAIGRVLQALDKHKLSDDTLVIFTSDNGGFTGVADNRPLRSGKGYLYEGGIRVPLIVRWPGRVKAGTLCKTPVISTDLFPTILEAASLRLTADAPLDGESLVPLLQQSGKLKRSALFFHYPNYAWHGGNRLGGAVRDGDYKLIERYEDGSMELYNLADDLGEKRNLTDKMPKRAAMLREKLRKWLLESGAAMPAAK